MIPRRKINVTRFDAGAWVDGVWQEGSPTVTEKRFSVHPTSPDDMDLLPEGRRSRRAYTLVGDAGERLRTAHNGKNADRVEIDGEEYEAAAVQVWDNKIIPHSRNVVIRVEQDEGEEND